MSNITLLPPVDGPPIERWMEDFCACLKQGKDGETCARRVAGMPLAMVMEHVNKNAAFRMMWEDIIPAGGGGEALVGTRMLTSASLEALLYGQCTDEEAAAYFGMSVDELTTAIEEDEGLKRVHKYARTGGKASIKVAQYEKAMTGDSAMLTWAGKQVLGQTDKVDVSRLTGPEQGSPVTINQIVIQNLPTDTLERMLEQARGHGHELVIEGHATRVTEPAAVITVEGTAE